MEKGTRMKVFKILRIGDTTDFYGHDGSSRSKLVFRCPFGQEAFVRGYGRAQLNVLDFSPSRPVVPFLNIELGKNAFRVFER